MLIKFLSLASLANLAYTKSNIDLTGNGWTLTNQQRNVSIPGSVPSYAQLDLFAAGVIGDPLYGELLLEI